MKLAAVMVNAATMALLAAAGAQGQDDASRQIAVYFNAPPQVPTIDTIRARNEASRMFAAIGVTLQWRTGRTPKSPADAIVVDVLMEAPAASYPGALAHAYPYEGTHIQMFWDRIRRDPESRTADAYVLLAHVLVHEITHILQGVARHSSEGIMKAQWTMVDRLAMKSKPMTFTAEDVDLIYLGMDRRFRAAKKLVLTAGVE